MQKGGNPAQDIYVRTRESSHTMLLICMIRQLFIQAHGCEGKERTANWLYTSPKIQSRAGRLSIATSLVKQMDTGPYLIWYSSSYDKKSTMHK